MTYFLIFFLAVFFGWLCWHRLEWGLYLVLICLPAYGARFHFLVPLTILELMILILFFVWLVKIKKNKELRPRSKFIKIAVLITIISLVSALYAPNLMAALGIWKAYFLEALFFFLVFSGVVKDREKLEKVILSLGFLALYLSLFAIIQKIFNGWLVPETFWLGGEGERVTSFFSYPNALGLLVAPIITLFVGYLISNFQFPISGHKKFEIRNWKLFFSLAIIICGGLAIYFAKSDGAIVGLAAGLVFLGLVIKKTRLMIVGILLLFIIYLLFAGVPDAIWQKVTFSDWSGQTRLTTWRETGLLLKDHWLLGAGLAGYQTAIIPYHQAKYLEIFLYPHNFILNFWVELGLAGLLTFVYIIGKYFVIGLKLLRQKSEVRSQKLLVVTLMAVMVTILVHGLVDVPYFKNDLAILWWVVVGMMSSLTII